MTLCRFSRSTIFRDEILAACPLSLTANAAKKCPCKKREFRTLPVETRVITCTHPLDWRGRPYRPPTPQFSTDIPNPEAFDMTAATASPPKPDNAAATDSSSQSTCATGTGGTTTVGTAVAIAKQPGELTLYEKLRDIDSFIDGLKTAIEVSGLFPNVTPGAAYLLAVEAVARKQTPLQLAQTFHVIEGRLSMRADATLAEFNRMGGTHQLIERTPEAAEVALTFGKQKQHRFRITWDEAKAEGFVYKNDGKTLKKNWSTPRMRMQMLWARVVSDGVRAICPSVNCGRYTPEEIADFDGSERAGIESPAVDTAWQQIKSVEAAMKAQGAAQDAGFVDAEFTVKEVEKSAVAEEAKVEPPVTAAPPKEEPTFDTNPIAVEPPHPLHEAPEVENARLIAELTEIKKDLGIVKADWLKLLSKYGVTTAKDMNNTQLANLLLDIKPAYERKKSGEEWQRFMQTEMINKGK